MPPISSMRGTGELSPPENPDAFTVVVFGDNRPEKGETEQPWPIKAILKEIDALQPEPAFALSLGDVIKGKPKKGDPDSLIIGEFKDFLALASTAGTPIFNAPGNHEMDDHDDIPTERMHELYKAQVAPTHGAFTYGNSRFITLNTEDVPSKDTPPPPEGEEFSYMSQKQIDELEADLETHRDKAHIFITMHYPIHAENDDDLLYPESRDALLTLFENYDNIAYVMAAHEHQYYNPQDPSNVTAAPGWGSGDPIVYLVSGGAGAPLNQGPGGFYHYLVFTVDGANVSVELVKPIPPPGE